MNIDEAISRLEEIRRKLGGDIEVWTTDDTGGAAPAETAEVYEGDPPLVHFR